VELKTTTIHGHRIGYYLAGSGPALVLLHGIGSSSLTWKRVIELLSRRYTVIAPDLLGHGASERLRGDYSLGAHASGVRDLLVKLGLERATICGHSLGGGVAMVFAYQFPDRCERLVLVSSGGLGQEVSPLLRLLSLPGSDLLVPLGTFPGLTRTVSRVGGVLGRLGLRLSPRADELWQCYRSLANPDARKAFLSTLREVIDFQGQRVSAFDRLYLASQVPVMIVWGSQDEIIPVEHARAAHREMPRSRLEIFEGVGHFPHAEQPDHFVRLVDDFIAQNRPARVSAATWRKLLEERSHVRRPTGTATPAAKQPSPRREALSAPIAAPPSRRAAGR